MVGRVGGRRDSSFLCLLTIYAAHVLLFHVLAVAPLAGAPAPVANASRRLERALEQPAPDLSPSPSPGDDPFLAGDPHQVFVRSSSACLWESSFTNLLNNYPKMHVDFSLLSHYFHRIKSIFTTAAWSSSTWGIISGCAIFLLTYTERENAQ